MQTIIDAGDGADALWINQLYTIAAGGDFWESGGDVTPGSSSTEIEMSVSAVTVNIGGESVSHGSQPVTLSSPSSDPRCDVIFADNAGVDKVEGVELAKLPSDNQFPSIRQPGPNNGSLVGGVPLAVVFVQSSDSVSSDIESWQIQDRRMDGDLLTPADHVAAVEAYDVPTNGPVETTVQDTERAGGELAGRYQRNQFTLAAPPSPTQLDPGETAADIMAVPEGHRIQIDRTSLITSGNTNPSGLELAVRLLRSGTTFEPFRTANAAVWDESDTGPIENIGPKSVRQRLSVQIENTGSSTISGAQGRVTLRIEDTNRDVGGS